MKIKRFLTTLILFFVIFQIQAFAAWSTKDLAPDFQGINPITGVSVNSPFGWRNCFFHTGVDLPAINGTSICATADGKVESVFFKKPYENGNHFLFGKYRKRISGYSVDGYGNWVVINHGVFNGKTVKSYYCHISNVKVTTGQIVKAGQPIAAVGSVGMSTGPHLHFEIRVDNTQVNPAYFVLFPNAGTEDGIDFLYGNADSAMIIKRLGFPTILYNGHISMQTDLFNPVFKIDLNDGSDLFNKEISAKRKEYNEAIKNNSLNKTISLYDRFGGNIKFVPYFGEKKVTLNFADVFYENLKENNGDFKFKLSDIWAKRSGVLNTEIYPNRPPIISEPQRNAGFIDPRREQFGNVNIGADASLGNMYLGISNAITKTILWLNSNEIISEINSTYDSIISDINFNNFLKTLINSLIPICLGFVIFYVGKSTVNIYSGKTAIKDFITKFANILISMGFIFAVLANPKAISNFTNFFIDGVNNLYAISFNQTAKTEVCKSDDTSLVTEAIIWEHNIFEPWCKGTFGKNYDEMYTEYSGKTNLEQSNEDISEANDDNLKYNSVKHTGDIKIPIGNGVEVRNWAALAWSTQSIYHIDAGYNGVNNNNTYGTLSPCNPSIYVDNFRWLDAKMNISPEYYSSTEYIENYATSHNFEQNFVLYGFKSMFLSLLLFPVIFPILKRFISLFILVFASARIIINGILNSIYIERSRYNILSTVKSIGISIYHYFWWSLIVFIILNLYLVLTTSFIGSVFYLVLSIVIIKSSAPIDNLRQFRQVKEDINRKYKQFKKYICLKLNLN